MLRLVGLCLCVASVEAVGLLRMDPEGELKLLAPRRFDMECELGCSFQPFCLPGPCTQEEEDENRLEDFVTEAKDILAKSTRVIAGGADVVAAWPAADAPQDQDTSPVPGR